MPGAAVQARRLGLRTTAPAAHEHAAAGHTGARPWQAGCKATAPLLKPLRARLSHASRRAITPHWSGPGASPVATDSALLVAPQLGTWQLLLTHIGVRHGVSKCWWSGCSSPQPVRGFGVTIHSWTSTVLVVMWLSGGGRKGDGAAPAEMGDMFRPARCWLGARGQRCEGRRLSHVKHTCLASPEPGALCNGLLAQPSKREFECATSLRHG